MQLAIINVGATIRNAESRKCGQAMITIWPIFILSRTGNEHIHG
jgi:hypothetical protein